MNLSRVDLNLLVALDALIEERHVTRAAERVHLSQPAMSSALARLRRLFGDELLVRVGREYRLTPLAAELQEPLSELLQLAKATIERRPHFDPSTDQRTFTVVASGYSAFLLMQPLIERIVGSAPGISLQIEQARRGAPEKVHADLNLGLWPSASADEMGLPYEILSHDRWVCAVSDDNHNIGSEITLEQYARSPRVAYGFGLEGIIGLADRTVLPPDELQEARVSIDNFVLLPFLLHGTGMVAFVQERLGRKLAASAAIRLVQPAFETPPVAEAMYWRPRSTADPAHRWLRATLQEIASRL